MEWPREVAPVRPGEEQDWEALAVYVRTHIPEIGQLKSVAQFPAGSANLTYLLRFDIVDMVLRRPPLGRIAVGAHDMGREYAALSKLWKHFPRAPRSYLYCEDPGVIGAHFVLSEYRPGVVIRGVAPAEMLELPQLGRRIGFAVVDALIDLHSLDPKSCDLEGLGKSHGFVERQVHGWLKRWAAVSNTDGKSDIERAGRRLSLNLPNSEMAAIIHNDFKVDNCQFDHTNPDRVKSIFDWDMVTIGDPLVDLGILLNYWPDESDDSEDGPVFPIGLDLLGLPGRREIREYYRPKLA
jgi:aminoglycoside phosphotransferase (APT) family kinase protein